MNPSCHLFSLNYRRNNRCIEKHMIKDLIRGFVMFSRIREKAVLSQCWMIIAAART